MHSLPPRVRTNMRLMRAEKHKPHTYTCGNTPPPTQHTRAQTLPTATLQRHKYPRANASDPAPTNPIRQHKTHTRINPPTPHKTHNRQHKTRTQQHINHNYPPTRHARHALETNARARKHHTRPQHDTPAQTHPTRQNSALIRINPPTQHKARNQQHKTHTHQQHVNHENPFQSKQTVYTSHVVGTHHTGLNRPLTHTSTTTTRPHGQ